MMSPMGESDTGKKGGESLLTVVIAFAANLLIAIAKTVAAVFTGSASMVAEASHSWADTGNEIFLLIAERRSDRPRDAGHPFGYGRELYFWTFVVSIMVFALGALVSFRHGLAHVMKLAPTLPKDAIVVLNLSGRGDKDIFTVAHHLGVKL